jgi:hypothetical protein
MRQLKRVLACILGVFLFLPGPCFAQQAKELDVKILAGLNEIYDSNVTFLKDDPVDDFITRLSLGLDLNYQAKTTNFSLLGYIASNIYAKNSDFNNTSEDITLAFNKDFSKYDSLSITDTFTNAEDPSSFQDAFGRAAGRYSHLMNAFSTVYTRAISKTLSLLGRLGNQVDYFSTKDNLDSVMSSIGAELNYALSSATILLLSNDFSRRNFLGGPAANTDTLLAGIKHYFTSQLSLEGRAGVDFLESYNRDKFTEPVIILSLIDEIDKNTRSTVSFTKRYDATAYEQDLFDYQEFSANIFKQLSQRFTGSLRAFYGQGEYAELGITDRLAGLGVGLSYDLRENIKLRASYAYAQTDSTADDRDYKKNLFSLGCTMEF